MVVRSDRWIRRMALEHGMIEPFCERNVHGVISFGISSVGYDVRLSGEFKIFRGKRIDPKDPDGFEDFRGNVCEIPPNSFALGRSVEYFRIPRDVVGICVGKSTYARCGIIVNTTPLEPGWEGHVTISISNSSPVPAKIYAGEGIAQVIFLQAEEPESSYGDKGGKYQAQRGVTTAKI